MTDEQMAQLATLTPEEERKLHETEEDLGDVYLIAYEKPLIPAPLEEEEVQKLQEVEREMPGLILVAYKKM